MLSSDLETSLNVAIQSAREGVHEFITVEHLLLALLDNPSASRAIRACGGDVDRLQEELNSFLDQHVPLIPKDSEEDPQPGLGFQRVIQRAILHVQSTGKKEVNGTNVLIAMFAEKESHAVYFLHQQDVTRFDVVNFIAHGIAKVNDEGLSLPAPDGDDVDLGDKDDEEGRSALAMFAINLNEQAMAGRIDPLIGRGSEIERTIQILCRRRKNNPLFVGEAGVGKTAIAEVIGVAVHQELIDLDKPLPS